MPVVLRCAGSDETTQTLTEWGRKGPSGSSYGRLLLPTERTPFHWNGVSFSGGHWRGRHIREQSVQAHGAASEVGGIAFLEPVQGRGERVKK